MEEVAYTLGNCVDCDSCNHRSETCLCNISTNEEDKILIKRRNIIKCLEEKNF